MAIDAKHGRTHPPPMHFHFIGICGTAMGSVAAALRDLGHTVTGSDANPYPPMSTFLEDKGIKIAEGYRAGNLPEDREATIVVGNAISRGNEEVEAALEQRRFYTSLPEILKDEFLRGRRNLVVTGTHGKTTTSSMLGWILKSAGRDPSWMIGGIPGDLGKGCHLAGKEFTVLEGDEYDTAFFDKRSKFVHYLPEVVVVNNLEFDHADIFDDHRGRSSSASGACFNIVPRNGCVFVNGDDAELPRRRLDLPGTRRVKRVGFSEVLRPAHRGGQDDRCRRALRSRSRASATRFRMDGEFNVRNAAMAVCARALRRHRAGRRLRAGPGQFPGRGAPPGAFAGKSDRGIRRGRRFRAPPDGDSRGPSTGHAPALDSGTARLWAIFEPRSNTTRRSVFQDELAARRAQPTPTAHLHWPPWIERWSQVPADEERLDPEQRHGGPSSANGTSRPSTRPDADAIVERA